MNKNLNKLEALTKLHDTITTLRIYIQDMLLDLEATRRERDEFKRMWEELDDKRE